MNEVLERLRRGLIVSCQVNTDEPEFYIRCGRIYLFRRRFVLAMAKAAEIGGAKGVRIEGIDNIRTVKRCVGLPVIGLVKRRYRNYSVYITPTLRDVIKVIEAGAEIVAVDATKRRRPGKVSLKDIVKKVKTSYDVILLADVSTLHEGIVAEKIGFDAVATTLAGYTSYSKPRKGPSIRLVKHLSRTLKVPVIAEGRIKTINDVRKAFNSGAHAVVIGTAITRPYKVIRDIVSLIRK